MSNEQAILLLENRECDSNAEKEAVRKAIELLEWAIVYEESVIILNKLIGE